MHYKTSKMLWTENYTHALLTRIVVWKAKDFDQDIFSELLIWILPKEQCPPTRTRTRKFSPTSYSIRICKYISFKVTLVQLLLFPSFARILAMSSHEETSQTLHHFSQSLSTRLISLVLIVTVGHSTAILKGVQRWEWQVLTLAR
jgi:hypothetical protein